MNIASRNRRLKNIRCGGEGGDGRGLPRADIAGVDVGHVDAHAFESADDRERAWPVGAELLTLLGEPFGENVFREVDGLLELCGGEVEDEGGRTMVVSMIPSPSFRRTTNGNA